MLRDLNLHISRGFKTVSQDLKRSFEVLLNLLDNNRPRRVDVNFFEWLHLYVMHLTTQMVTQVLEACFWMKLVLALILQ